MNINEEIRNRLFDLQDLKYKDFSAKIIPTVSPEKVLGIRTPDLRKYAKQLVKREDVTDFLRDLPHEYFDENQLHAFIISEIKDFDRCIDEVERFLPYIDNWATCDQLSPKVFAKHHKELLVHIQKWIKDEKTYTIRFGIGLLMQHFLDDDFDIKYPNLIAKIRSNEYYVNMMIAWYFATALAKQYDAILPFIEDKKLDKWTHNKAIQKSVESYRITKEQKEFLKGLKVK